MGTILAVTFYGKSAIYFIHSHSKMNVLYQLFIIIGGLCRRNQTKFYSCGLWQILIGNYDSHQHYHDCSFFAKPALEELKQYENFKKKNERV